MAQRALPLRRVFLGVLSICTNASLTTEVEWNVRRSDTLADSRVQNPKNVLAFFSRLLHREAEKEMERKFLVLLRRSHNNIVL